MNTDISPEVSHEAKPITREEKPKEDMCKEGGGATMEEGKKRALNSLAPLKWTFLLALCLSFPTSFYASVTTLLGQQQSKLAMFPP